MEDRVEVFLDDVAEIPCIYKMNGSVSSPTIQWFVVSEIFSYVAITFLRNFFDIQKNVHIHALLTLMRSYNLF